MNKTRVSAALAEALSSDPATRVSALPAALRRALPDELVDEIVVGEMLTPILKAEPPFNEAGAHVLSMGTGGGLGFRPDDAGRYLVRRVQSGRTCDQAVADLEALLVTHSAECIAVAALWGVDVESVVALPDNMSLIPFATIPDSATKRWIEEASENYHASRIHVPMMFQTTPTSAVCCRFTASPVIVHGNAKLTAQISTERLRDVAVSLALIGPSCPVVGPSWVQYVDPAIEQAKLGIMTSGSMMDIVPSFFGPPVRLSADDVQQVVGDFLKVCGNVRARLERTLTRFHRSVRWRDDGDKAVDLAIALESLLTDGPGEHAFKTALRAGLLVEGTLAQRQRARAVVQTIYRIRSAVVHDGVASPSVTVAGVQEKTDAVVKEATSLTATVIRRIAHDGRLPDWPQLELRAEDD